MGFGVYPNKPAERSEQVFASENMACFVTTEKLGCSILFLGK